MKTKKQNMRQENQIKGSSLSSLRNEKGVALVSVYLISVLLSGISIATYTRAISQSRSVDREIARLKSFAAAEAGIQSAMAQIGNNAYTGYINTSNISAGSFSSTYGHSVGNYSVTMDYPNSADWVIIHASATVNGETQQLEGRVFLNSNLSKYLIYSNTSTLSLGSNLILGSDDGVNPQGVPEDPNDRAATYHTNDLDFSGTNIHVYADAHAENLIDGSTNSYVHGDTYVGAFATNASGAVTNDGINGSLSVTDGFSDGTDRNNDGVINASDYPDNHDLTSTGDNDSHRIEELDGVDLDFYQSHNDANIPSSWGSTTTSRYIKLLPSADNTKTKVVEYSSSTYTTQVATYTLANTNSIIYNKGRLHIKEGSITGRVSVVSGDDIMFDGNVAYNGGASYATSSHSAAFIAKDKVFLRPTSLEISGIVYAKKDATAGTVALDSDYDTSGNYNPTAKTNGHFRLFGNVIMDGTGNTANYANDRAYVYDQNLKYFRPPGIPVRPELRLVVEE